MQVERKINGGTASLHTDAFVAFGQDKLTVDFGKLQAGFERIKKLAFGMGKIETQIEELHLRCDRVGTRLVEETDRLTAFRTELDRNTAHQCMIEDRMRDIEDAVMRIIMRFDQKFPKQPGWTTATPIADRKSRWQRMVEGLKEQPVKSRWQRMVEGLKRG